MITKDYDPAMTYENLARAVFQCGRWEGPYDCAEASVFDLNFVPSSNERGRLIIQCLIDRIIADGEYSEEQVDYLLDRKNIINDTIDQGETITTIHDLIDFLNGNGY